MASLQFIHFHLFSDVVAKRNKLTGGDMSDWVEGFPGEISVCDRECKNLVLNKKIADYFESSGGKDLVGNNPFDGHGRSLGEEIRKLMTERSAGVYIAAVWEGVELCRSCYYTESRYRISSPRITFARCWINSAQILTAISSGDSASIGKPMGEATRCRSSRVKPRCKMAS